MSREEEADRIEREREEKEWRTTTRACALFVGVVLGGLLLSWLYTLYGS